MFNISKTIAEIIRFDIYHYDLDLPYSLNYSVLEATDRYGETKMILTNGVVNIIPIKTEE